jgi:superfamily I DNA/RNA helicase
VPRRNQELDHSRIHAATSRFYRGEPLCALGPEGREVECITVASPADIEDAVGKVLHRLTAKEHLQPSDIAVLAGSSHGSPLKKEERIGAVAVTKDQTAEPGKVLVDSIRRFKGLERPVIVLAGIDDLPPEDEKGLLYVGLSRARVYLVVVATAMTLERLGLVDG